MMSHLHCSSCSSSSYCSSGSLVGEAEAGALEGRTGFSPSALDKQLSLLLWTNKSYSLHLTNTCCSRLFWLHPKIASGKSHKFLSTIVFFPNSSVDSMYYVSPIWAQSVLIGWHLISLLNVFSFCTKYRQVAFAQPTQARTVHCQSLP